MNATTRHPVHGILVVGAARADVSSVPAALRGVARFLGDLLQSLGRFMPPAFSSFAAVADDLDGVSRLAEIDFHGSQGLL